MIYPGFRGKMETAAEWPLRAMQSLYGWPNRLVGWCRRNGRFAGNEDGGSMIEFAIVSTAMMMFILVVMQICVALYSYGMICETAREATRWAVTRGSTCQTASLTSCTADAAHISAYAKGLRLPNIGGGTVNINVTPNVMFPDTFNGTANCQAAKSCRVVVQITYVVPIKMPLVPKNSISLSTQSVMFYLQ